LISATDVAENLASLAINESVQAYQGEGYERVMIHVSLALTYLAQGRLDDAVREFDALASKQPRDVTARTMAAILVEMQGRLDDATARYEQIVKLDPRAAVASNNLAWRYAETGKDLGAALRLAQAAYALMPQRPEVLDTLGVIYLRQGQPALALAPLREAVEHAPDNPVYRARLGQALADAGQNDAARRELEQALKAGDKFPGAAEAKALLARLPS